MRKLLLGLAVLAGLFAGNVASADPTHGLCTAYFNGSQTGQANKRKATAFVEFANYVGDNDGVDNDGDGDVDEGDEVATPTDVWNFCLDTDNNPKGIGGQPDDPNTVENDGNGKNGRGKG